MAIEIRPRSAWKARPARRRNAMNTTRAGWFIHFNGPPMSGPTEARLRAVQDYHMDKRGWYDFAYSFAVGDDGVIWEGRGWGIAGGHTEGFNVTSHAVFVPIGQGQEPTDACAASIRALIAEGGRRGYESSPIRPHNAVANKACPGATLTRWIAEGRLTPGAGGPMPAALTPDRAETILTVQRVLTGLGIDIGATGPNSDGVDGDPGPATRNGILTLNHRHKRALESIADLEHQLGLARAQQQDDEGRINDLQEQVEGLQQDLAGCQADLDAAVPAEAVNWANVRALLDRLDEEVGHPDD